MKTKNELIVITCPHCGAEYLPAEIYYPNELLGKPKHIERDSNNKIITFDGHTMNNKEAYICDFCSKKFFVEANISFETKNTDKYDFDTDYVSPLIEKKISLFEGD